jgi:hypothetical protein
VTSARAVRRQVTVAVPVKRNSQSDRAPKTAALTAVDTKPAAPRSAGREHRRVTKGRLRRRRHVMSLAVSCGRVARAAGLT